MKLILLLCVAALLVSTAIADDTLSRSVLHGMQTRYAKMVARESETCSLLTMAVESADPENRIHGLKSSSFLPEQLDGMHDFFRMLRESELDPNVSERLRIIFYNLEQRERALNPPFHPLEAEIAGKLRAKALEVHMDQDAYVSLINPGLAKNVDDSVIDLILSLQRVRTLNLPSKSITNEAFGRLSKLTSIENLNIPTSVSDAGLTWLGDAPHLRTFAAHNITDETLHVLSKSKTLQYFSTSSAMITNDGMKSLAKIETLRNLDLPDQINAEGISHLTSLELISLSKISRENSDALLVEIGKIHTLEHLSVHLMGTTPDGFAALTELKSLRQLHTGGIDGYQVHLKKFPRLESLLVGKIDSQSLPDFLACTQLKFLMASIADLPPEERKMLDEAPFDVKITREAKKR
jgi:hypothetical protein